jgi:hypothetical protein
MIEARELLLGDGRRLDRFLAFVRRALEAPGLEPATGRGKAA